MGYIVHGYMIAKRRDGFWATKKLRLPYIGEKDREKAFGGKWLWIKGLSDISDEFVGEKVWRGSKES